MLFYLCSIVIIRLSLIFSLSLILVQVGVIPNSIFLTALLTLVGRLLILILIGPLCLNLTLSSNSLTSDAVAAIYHLLILPLRLLVTCFLWSAFWFKFLFVDDSIGLVDVIQVPIILIVYNVWVYTVVHVHSSCFYLAVPDHLLVVLYRLPHHRLCNVDVAHVLQVFSVVQW